MSLCRSGWGEGGGIIVSLVVRQLVAVGSLKTEAAPGESFQVEGQLALGLGLRGRAGGVVRVRVQGGG